jgi:nucleoside-diphosphate-sugar epimerase
MNAHVPALVAEAFAGSRIVAYSSGCVYPYVDVRQGGAAESTPAVPPPGVYAYSCVAREAMFQYFSRLHQTPGRIIRLNYAIDMRYGVLSDIAARVHTGTPLDLTMGHVNVIWQGDANEFVLRALNHCTVPSSPLNVSGPQISVRWLAEQFGQRLGKPPVFTGAEAPDAWLVDTSESIRLFGAPRVPLTRMIDWTADWVVRGLPSLGKDTHFDTRDGAF